MEDYEANTGKVIIETVDNGGYDPMAIPVVLEKVAEMDLKTLALNPKAKMETYILDKHYMRKHGPNAYYGQR